MAVQVVESRKVHAGDGTTQTFSTPFFSTASDLVVTFLTDATATALALDEDYTLEGDGEPLGGTLTLTNTTYVPSPDAGSTLVITSALQPTQLRRLPESGPFPSSEVEAALDKLSILVQQLQLQLQLSPRAPDNDLALLQGSFVLPRESQRANKFQAYDSNGLPKLYDIAGLALLVDGYLTGGSSVRSIVLSREELGIAGDGVTDDSAALNAAIELWSGRGGATFFLRAADDQAFRLNYSVVNRSFVQLQFASPVQLADGARLCIKGGVATTSTHGLVSAATAGGSSLAVDTGPAGGGALSDYFAAGDWVLVEGAKDSAGNVIQEGEHRVTAVDDGLRTLTVSPTLGFTYPVSGTTVKRIAQGLLTSNGTAGSNTVEVAASSIGEFGLGDIVEISTHKTSADAVTSGSTEYVEHETLQIIAIGEGSGTDLTFNRKLARTYATAYGARVVRLDPARRASIQGASVEFLAAPTAQAHTFEVIRGVDCALVDCEVPNDDAFGSQGDMFRLTRCYQSRVERCLGRNPKSLLDGHGRGASLVYSTDCSVDVDVDGCRQGVYLQGATACTVSPKVKDDRQHAISFAGCGEADCLVKLRSIAGGSKFASGVTTRHAIHFGNDANRVGPFRCKVEGGLVTQYKGTGVRAIRFFVGAEECIVTGVTFSDITTLVYHADSGTQPALLASRNSVEECVVNGYDGKLIDIHGGRNGSATKTAADYTLRDIRAYGGSQHIFLTQVAGARVIDVTLDKVTVDPTEPYAVKAVDVTGLAVSRGLFIGIGKGIAATTCPAFRITRNDFWDLTLDVVFQDNGGSTDGNWRFNDAVGFSPLLDETGTPSTDLVYYPLLISATADFVTVP